MSNRSPNLLLQDIIDSAEKILAYTDGLSYEQFISDNKTKDAVIRNFEIIGEAANRLPDEMKIQYPNIDWIRLRGFRNRIVHDYMGIDYKIVWVVRESFLQPLISDISKLIALLRIPDSNSPD